MPTWNSSRPKASPACNSVSTRTAWTTPPSRRSKIRSSAPGSTCPPWPSTGITSTRTRPGAGYELRLVKPIGAEVGITEAGLPGTSCDRFGCTHPRETLKFLDYGLRGHIALSGGRIDLSAGLGGGYVWHLYETFFT